MGINNTNLKHRPKEFDAEIQQVWGYSTTPVSHVLPKAYPSVKTERGAIEQQISQLPKSRYLSGSEKAGGEELVLRPSTGNSNPAL